MSSKPKIVVLGGGTGTFTVLSGLKKYDVDLTAVVSVADDGGSTGILRDELGVLPPGDIRQCLVALAAGDDVLRTLFTYRFHEGSLSGQNFGNLFLSALEKITGDPLAAVREAHRILQVKGRVLPVSSQASCLFAELMDGTIVEGEHAIDQTDRPRSPIRRCFLSPSIRANPEALAAIREADAIVMGPGDVYTSLIPVLLIEGVIEALAASQGRRLFVINLMTKKGQTDGYGAVKFCETVLQYCSPARLDAVFINNDLPTQDLLDRYTVLGERVVIDDIDESGCLCKSVIRKSFLAKDNVKSVAGDKLRRSLIRHDSERLAESIVEFIAENR